MQRTLIQEQDSSETKAEVKNKLQIKEYSHLFNSVDKLAVDHDVYVSNTMIKVTYKKALKDQNVSENLVESNENLVFTKSLNQKNKKKSKDVKTMNLCNNDISFITKSPNIYNEDNKAFAYHSTPKPQSLAAGKKSKYMNGLNLSPKPNDVNDITPTKIQKKFLLSTNGASNLKKSKTTPIKALTQLEVSKKFLKGNNAVVKQKANNIQRDSAEAKKETLHKAVSKKFIKLENNVKEKKVEKKGFKRKTSSTDLNILAKKIKTSENETIEMEGEKKVEGNCIVKTGKRPIMMVDPDLPTGWTRYIRTKNKGSDNEQYVVYVVNPQGKKFRFKWKLRKYLEKINSSLDVDRFFFGLYQRPKSSNASAGDKDEQLKSDTPEGKFQGELASQEDSEVRDSKQDEGSNSDTSKGSQRKELLLFDPDLPFGWKRVIHSNRFTGKKQVHIISPDGKIFRRRYRLNEYLNKHQYTHDLDRFYFGLYRKKDDTVTENSGSESMEKTPTAAQSNNYTNNKSISMKNGKGKKKFKMSENVNFEGLSGNRQLRLILRKIDESGAIKQGAILKTGDESAIVTSENEKDYFEFRDESPMYDDPNLPEGWRRFIRIRSFGVSAGRMEVVIVSPDGRKHRSKKHLKHYFSEKNLRYKAEDFDFHVFGKSSLKKRTESMQGFQSEQEPEHNLQDLHSESNDFSFPTTKKKLNKPVPELNIDSLKEVEFSHEGCLINKVNGLAMSVGLSSARNERRQKLPRREHEKQLKTFLSSKEAVTSSDGCEIPTTWIQTLLKCRGDFRTLEPDAASTVGEAAKEFIQQLSFLALSKSEKPDKGLRYEDVADIVHQLDSLSPLQTLIPKKITYKEYIKLNRPKQFLSFT